MLSKAQIKYIRSLRQKKYRHVEGVFPVEGTKPVTEMLGGDIIRVVSLFAVEDWIARHLPGRAGAGAFPVHAVTAPELAQISGLDTPAEVMALCEIPAVEPPDPSGRLTLALEAVRDPGNLGTIIRIADWFGLETVVCSPDCVDAYNLKTIQATMGSIARVRVASVSLDQWLDRYPKVELLAATLEGEPVMALGRVREGVLVIGNESVGLSPAIVARAHRRVTIPRLGGAESLNAAIATAILVERLLL
jgi:TrmH family RNA methyltransferase